PPDDYGGAMADCLFCRIVAGEVPATIVKRSGDAVAFRDVDPRAPTHVLVIPTRHVAAVRDVQGAQDEAMLGRVLRFAAEVASEQGLDPGGYRIVTNTGNDAGQSVDHLHFHVLGGRKLSWPPG
ncbi:MAG TPA: histidine triad nucleotide-binding protein, partial [Gemmatimonadales bacterium]|nr:histidine triad nucleotide-binding protein [Gemmatimonadales bacterium]